MAEHMTDEEQLQVLKNWWKENGRSLVLMVSTALIAYFGWQGWSKHQKNQAEAASAIYSELMETAATHETLSDEKRTTAEFLIRQLQDQHGRSLYAVSASLLGAKLALEKGDLTEAEAQLKRALKSADSDSKSVVSLRLARVYLAQEKYDQALALVETGDNNHFAGLFAEVRGDILAAKGSLAEAKGAYQLALDSVAADNPQQQRFIEIKLANLVAGEQ